MRRVGTRRRVGGKALASGTDGCVFDKRFNEDGSIIDVPDIVSKVFPKEKGAVARNEFSILAAVKNVIPDGKGVVVGDAQLKTINAVTDTIGDKARTGMAPNACGRVMMQKDSPFYVIEYPRIDGSMIDLNKRDVPISFFDDAIQALQTLSQSGLVHMDIAARNVFVKNEKALIGDFGNMINTKDTRNLPASIKSYLSKYSINTIGDCLVDQGTTSTLRIAMLMYVTEDMSSIKQQIEHYLQPYKEKGRTIYEFSDVYYEADAKAHPSLHDKLTEEMRSYLETMKGITNKSILEAIMLSELHLTDIRMLALLMSERCEQTEELPTRVFELWNLRSWMQVYLQSRLAALRKGGKRTRRKRVKISRKHK